jgi:hypothetical protein
MRTELQSTGRMECVAVEKCCTSPHSSATTSTGDTAADSADGSGDSNARMSGVKARPSAPPCASSSGPPMDSATSALDTWCCEPRERVCQPDGDTARRSTRPAMTSAAIARDTEPMLAHTRSAGDAVATTPTTLVTSSSARQTHTLGSSSSMHDLT